MNMSLRWSDEQWNFSEPKTYVAHSYPLDHLIAEPQDYEDVVFAEDLVMKDEVALEFLIQKERLFDGFLLYLNLWVDQNTVVDSLNQKTNWGVVYIKLLTSPLELKVGDLIKAKIKRDVSTENPKSEIHTTVYRNESTLIYENQTSF